MADAGSLERGADYVARGRVHGLAHDGEVVVAEVVGRRRYRVRLWVEDGELAYVCTCPVGEDGRFCKHCVAVGLTWVDTRTSAAVPGSPRNRGTPPSSLRRGSSGVRISWGGAAQPS